MLSFVLGQILASIVVFTIVFYGTKFFYRRFKKDKKNE